MMSHPLSTLSLFYSYVDEDKKLQERLEMHLSILRALNLIKSWSYHELTAGTERMQEITNNLNKAHIILLLISPNFIASNYHYSNEMRQAIRRHDIGKARVIPVILRPVDWEGAPFDKLAVLPSNRKPVVSWQDPDDAFVDIAKGIRKVVQELLPFNTQIQTFSAFSKTSAYYEEALANFNSQLARNAHDTTAFYGRANALKALKRYQEAFRAYNQTLFLGYNVMGVYAGRAKTLYETQNYKEAIYAYNHLLYIAPNDPYCHYSYGIVWYTLQDFEKARNFFKKAVEINPAITIIYRDDENALSEPEGYKEL